MMNWEENNILPLSRLKQAVPALAVSVMLAACGGGSGSTAGAASGELAIALTDAEGDFLAYDVNVLSLELQKANGTTVETVPLSTHVDFAQYTEMTEFFTIATVPGGLYTSAKLTLDYSDASIVIENAAEEAVEATAVDAEGNPITTIEMTVQFNDQEPLEIRRGVPANMMIDFDLKASNEILSYEPALVEVDTYLVADLQLDGEREHRARGLLTSVDKENDSFVIDLRPFRHRQGRFGSLTVNVADTTAYEIDGVSYEGENGLNVLAELDENTPVVAHGVVTMVDDVRSYNADQVYAGSSVPWADRDAVKGTVIAREGDQLTVRGRYIDHTDGDLRYHSDINVMLGDETAVTRQAADNEGITIDSVSVGQAVMVLGQGSVADDKKVSLDATNGHLRMLVSTVKGQVDTLEPLTLDVALINKHRSSVYNFAGTGVDESNDADPEAYEVDTQTLTLTDLVSGELVAVKGFVAPFGAAPQDFIARTVINPEVQPMSAALMIKWEKGSDNPFTTLTDDSIVVDTEGARQQLEFGGHRNPHVTTESYTIVPAAEQGRYALKLRGQRSIQMYQDFADFSEALAGALQETSIKKILVKGRINVETGTVTTPSVHVLMW